MVVDHKFVSFSLKKTIILKCLNLVLLAHQSVIHVVLETFIAHDGDRLLATIQRCLRKTIACDTQMKLLRKNDYWFIIE